MIETDFSGRMYFDIWYSGTTSNPKNGDIIYGCKITMVNKIGIFAIKDHLQIIVTSKTFKFEFYSNI